MRSPRNNRELRRAVRNPRATTCKPRRALARGISAALQRPMQMRRILVAVIAVVGVGCVEPAAPADDANDGLDGFVAELSPAAQSAVEALRATHAEARGVTWDVSGDNSFASDWIVQTPLAAYWGQPAGALPLVTSCAGDAACDPDFDLRACASQADCTFGGTCTAVAATVVQPGQLARKLCVGHSDAMYDQIYNLLVTAQSSIEISTLTPPDGRFEAAVRNAITFIGDRDVRIRVIFGAVIGDDSRGTADVLHSLTRDLGATSHARVAVGEIRDGPLSWDHAKVIAVDGATAIVGGHNMWTRHYLASAPVHDLSMQVTGSAAAQAAHFVDALWRHTCTPPVDFGSYSEISGDGGCDETPLPAPAAGTGSAHVITVGRLGALGDNAADDAILALVNGAHTSLRLSLQDIGPVGAGADWPQPYLQALAAAVERGVDIQLIVTNLSARPDGLSAGSSSYSNGWTPADLIAHVNAYASAHSMQVAGDLCGHLHVAALRQGADDTWPTGATFANHAKLAIVDDATFYLGSQNWYPANLVELGFIVDDAAVTQQLRDGYFTKAWTSSARDVAACQ
jgi:phosphatidylserine/phosphatidylglycerophosphate/cardiolipin synthase-like enzyme